MTPYRLGAAAARSRARLVAAVGTAQALSPAALVVVLVHKLGYVTDRLAWWGGGALVVLALVRGVALYLRVAPRLLRFAAAVEDDGVRVTFAAADELLEWEELTGAVEIPGRLGGLRLETRGGRVDVPRGGDGFGELRAAVDARLEVRPAPRRARNVRVGLGALVVLAIFFVPFALDDVVGRSRLAALGVVGAVWLLLYLLRRR